MASAEVILMGTRLRAKIEQESKAVTPNPPPQRHAPLNEDCLRSSGLSSSQCPLTHSLTDHQVALLHSENAELHSRCEHYIKDLVKKDHQLADARKVNKECKEAQTKLELRNQQLENDQQAVQEYIDRLKAGQASTTSVVAKLQDGFESYQNDLSRLTILHETSTHALLGSHQDYRQLQEETKQKEESLRTLSHELDEERAQSTTLQLHNEETQSQLNRQSKFLKDVQEDSQKLRDMLEMENHVHSRMDEVIEHIQTWTSHVEGLTVEAKNILATSATWHDTAVIRKDEELTLLHDQMMILATVTHHATPAVLPSPATKNNRTKDAKKMHVATIPNQIDETKADKHAEESIGRKVFKRKQDCLTNTSESILPSQGVGAFKSRPTEATQQGTTQLPSTKTPVNPLPINPPNKIHQQNHNGRGGGSCPMCGDTAYGLMKQCQLGCHREFHSACARRQIATRMVSNKDSGSAGIGANAARGFTCDACLSDTGLKSNE